MFIMQEWIAKLRRPRPQESPQSALIEELRELRRQMDGIESCFALEADEDLLDAAIYQREALEARHRHLLRLAREQHAVAVHLPLIEENQERWIN